jgi:hypothetical protein
MSDHVQRIEQVELKMAKLAEVTSSKEDNVKLRHEMKKVFASPPSCPSSAFPRPLRKAYPSVAFHRMD